MSLGDLRQIRQLGRAKKNGCTVCLEPTVAIVTIAIDHLTTTHSRKTTKGMRINSRSVSFCAQHAEEFYRLMAVMTEQVRGGMKPEEL